MYDITQDVLDRVYELFSFNTYVLMSWCDIIVLFVFHDEENEDYAKVVYISLQQLNLCSDCHFIK